MRISRRLIALGAAALLTATTAFGCIALAEEGGKHFSIIEAASNADSLSIPEIAAQVGYADQKYFNRVFRKRTGLSPQEYRRSPTN